MKITSTQFRDRYNIAASSEAKLKKDKKVPYEIVAGLTVYDQAVTDKLAIEKKLGRNAYIIMSNMNEKTENSAEETT